VGTRTGETTGGLARLVYLPPSNLPGLAAGHFFYLSGFAHMLEEFVVPERLE
jgi:hypothetical protein